MARKMYTRDSQGNIVLKEPGTSGPVYNIPEPISRVGKIIPQIYQDIRSGEATSEFSPAAKFVGRGIKGLGNIVKKGAKGAGKAITSTIDGLLDAVKQERRKGIKSYKPQRKGITKYNMGADPEPNVSYDSYGEETSGYYDYSGETLGDANVYDYDTDYSGYTDVLEGPIENEPINVVEPIAEPIAEPIVEPIAEPINVVEPINVNEVNNALNQLVPGSEAQDLDTIVLKGRERYNALEAAGVFPDIIDWAMSHKHLPGLAGKSDNLFKNIASGEMSPREYKIIMRALQHAYDTKTGTKETYDLFKRLIPIYTKKPNA